MQWFRGLGLEEREIAERLKHCRHKALFEPASTPGHFWSVNFPTTQQCKEQGMSCGILLPGTVVSITSSYWLVFSSLRR